MFIWFMIYIFLWLVHVTWTLIRFIFFVLQGVILTVKRATGTFSLVGWWIYFDLYLPQIILCVQGLIFFYIAKYLRYTDWVMWEFWRPLPILVFGNIKKKFDFIFLFQTQKKYFICVVYLLVYTLPDLHGSTGSFVFGVPKVWQGSCRLPSDG